MNDLQRLSQSIDRLCEAKQNDNAANWQTEWRDQFAVRSQRIPTNGPANWLRDYHEYPMVQVNLRDVRNGLRDGPCATWWTVEAYGRDLVRQIPDIPGATAPGFADAMGAGFLTTSIQLRISQNADKPIFVDVGTGTRFSLLTDQIKVDLFVPGRDVAFAQRTSPPPVGGNPGDIVIDSTTTVIVTCSNFGGPIGNRISTLTRSYLVDETDVPGPLANTFGATTRGGNEGVQPGDFLIPPRSRTVQFSGAQLGRITFLDNPISRNSLGSLSFVLAPASVRDFLGPVEIPHNASIINFSNFAPGSVVTALYELEL